MKKNRKKKGNFKKRISVKLIKINQNWSYSFSCSFFDERIAFNVFL